MSIVGIGWLMATAEMESTEAGGFGLNTDILEANLVNLLIVIALLIYLGRGFLGKILSDRRSAIETAIQEAEERRQQAAAALADEQQRLAQAQQEANRIRETATERATASKAAILEQSERDIQRLRESVFQDVDAERAKIIAELRQRVAGLALAKVEADLPSHLNDDVQRGIIDRSIAMLGGAS